MSSARYEFSEGTSNKFWEIKLTPGDPSLTTTFGKIGGSGQTTIKKFGSAADAKKEHDKLVAEKVKKGYKHAPAKAAKADKPAAKAAKGAKAAPEAKPAKGKKATVADESGTRDARNPELEKAILGNPNDRDAYAVYADWLMEKGDPRGELISLQLGNKDGQAKKLIEMHAEYFLGPLAAHQKVYDDNGNNASSSLRSPAQEKEWLKLADQALFWRHGFIHRVRLSHNTYSESGFTGKLAQVLEQVFAHPSGRFVVELAFHSNGDPNEDDLQTLIDVIGKKAPPTIRKITFGDNVDQISWHHTGKLDKMWKAVPNLRTLDIESGEFDVGKMVAPKLEKARFITGGLSGGCAKSIATAQMPAIKHLEIYYGTDEYGGTSTIKDVKPLLDRTDLPKLEYLGLKNAEFMNEIAKAMPTAKILKQLKTLDLSLGTMTDEGAVAMAAHADAFKHLEVLDLTRNFLTKKGITAVKNLAKKVITGGQEQADEDDGDPRYYVSVAE